MRELVIGTVIAPFKAVDDEATQWLDCGPQLAQNALDNGFDKVHYMASIEVDARGMEPYAKLETRLDEVRRDIVETAVWKFAIDDGSDVINGDNRLIRICTGRNLIIEYALRRSDASHILFLDSDLKVPEDSVSKLLEMNAPFVGGDVPAYCLGGTPADQYHFPAQTHWNTAGFLLVAREVFRKIRWRTDIYDAGSTDDPCYAQDVVDAGFPACVVRKDIVGVHTPLVGLHKRNHDLRIYK